MPNVSRNVSYRTSARFLIRLHSKMCGSLVWDRKASAIRSYSITVGAPKSLPWSPQCCNRSFRSRKPQVRGIAKTPCVHHRKHAVSRLNGITDSQSGRMVSRWQRGLRPRFRRQRRGRRIDTSAWGRCLPRHFRDRKNIVPGISYTEAPRHGASHNRYLLLLL